MSCSICDQPLNVPGDPSTADCGGDCLRCMAEFIEDLDAIRAMRKDVPGWWEGLDEDRRALFAEMLEDEARLRKPSGRTPGGRR